MRRNTHGKRYLVIPLFFDRLNCLLKCRDFLLLESFWVSYTWITKALMFYLFHSRGLNFLCITKDQSSKIRARINRRKVHLFRAFAWDIIGSTNNRFPMAWSLHHTVGVHHLNSVHFEFSNYNWRRVLKNWTLLMW